MMRRPDALCSGMRMDRREFIVGSATLAASLSFLRCGPAPAEATQWMWAGGVTTESASVRALTNGDAVLKVSTAADLSGAIEVQAAAVNGGVQTFALSGLSPATRYFYTVGDAPIGTLKTFSRGPSSVRIAFGSCSNTGSQHSVFSTISDQDPDLFIHLGDMHYEDITANDVAAYRRALGQVFGSPVQSHLYSNTPVAYVWDDHDFGPNDASAKSPSRSAARQAYREMVPHYPLQGDGPIHQAFTIGNVRVILLDTRSERQGNTILGLTQLQWLMGEIERSSKTHSLVVLGSSVTWLGDETDTWGGFSKERETISRFIRERGIENLVMISGDAHMCACDDGRNNRYAGSRDPSFPIFLASSFDRPGSEKGGPYSGKVITGRGHFGMLEIEDDGVSPIQVTFTARDAKDKELLRHSLQMNQAPITMGV